MELRDFCANTMIVKSFISDQCNYKGLVGKTEMRMKLFVQREINIAFTGDVFAYSELNEENLIFYFHLVC